MKTVNIAEETTKVGEALAGVPLDQLILSMAKGIAWGQFDLDKVGMDVTKMMGVPGTVSIGDEKISMLEAGFLPSFYHFVDTILELKMEIQIRQEQTAEQKSSVNSSYQRMSERGSSKSRATKSGWLKKKAKSAYKSSSSSKDSSNVAYGKAVDTAHSQKYSQDLSASSLMRTKLVPKPAPDLLIERIQILLDKMREEAKAEATTGTEEEIYDKLMEKVEQQFSEELAFSEF